MGRTAAVLRFNFACRLREKALVNVLPALASVFAAYFVYSTDARLRWIVVPYIAILAPIAAIEGIDKYISLPVLAGFPLTLADAVRLLSAKYLAAGILTGSLLVGAVRPFIGFSLFEWVNVVVAAAYVSIILFLAMQLVLRNMTKPDLLFMAVQGVGVSITTLLWAVMYHLSPLLEIAASAALVVIFHRFIVGEVATSATGNICKVLESYR